MELGSGSAGNGQSSGEDDLCSISCQQSPTTTIVPTNDNELSPDVILIAVTVSVTIVLTLVLISISTALIACFLNKYCRAAKGPAANKPHTSSVAIENGPYQEDNFTLLMPRRQSVNLAEQILERVPPGELALFGLGDRLKALEFPHSEVCILGELQEMNVGNVYRGEALLATDLRTVLIKSLRVDAPPCLQEAFDEEVRLISSIDHSNILSLLAISTQEVPKYMIYEYLEFGSLREFLLSTSSIWLDMEVESTLASLPGDIETSTTVSSQAHLAFMGTEEMVAIGIQVANGLEYLRHKGIVVKDIATRNCQIGESLTVKISNFGFSYELNSSNYVLLEGMESPVPLRWLAPETLQNLTFTSQSDIWSYGILLWEIFSSGGQPYSNLFDEEVKESILSYQILSKPENCPKSIYKIMCKCWNPVPGKRLSLGNVKSSLQLSVGQFDLESVSRRFSLRVPSTPDLLRKTRKN